MGAQKERSYNTWSDEATVQGSSHAKREECRGGSGPGEAGLGEEGPRAALTLGLAVGQS